MDVIKEESNIDDSFSIGFEEKTLKKQRNLLLRTGVQVKKYDYAVSKVSRREISLSRDSENLIWTAPGNQSTRSSKVPVSSFVGILFGAKTRTFKNMIAQNRNFKQKVPEWHCFSIITKNRTLDFSCDDEDLLITVILAIQDVMLRPYLAWTRGDLLGRRGWMKVYSVARNEGKPMRQYFLERLKLLIQVSSRENQRKKRSLFSASQSVRNAAYRMAQKEKRIEKRRIMRTISVKNLSSSESLSLDALLKESKKRISQLDSISTEKKEQFEGLLNQLLKPTRGHKRSSSHSQKPVSESFESKVDPEGTKPNQIASRSFAKSVSFAKLPNELDRQSKRDDSELLALRKDMEDLWNIVKKMTATSSRHSLDTLRNHLKVISSRREELVALGKDIRLESMKGIQFMMEAMIGKLCDQIASMELMRLNEFSNLDNVVRFVLIDDDNIPIVLIDD